MAPKVLADDSLEATATAALFALASPVVVVNFDQIIGFVNDAAEDFFSSAADQLVGKPLSSVAGFDSPLTAVVDQVQARGAVVVDHAAELSGVHFGGRGLQIQGAPIGDDTGAVVILINRGGIAERLGANADRRGIARSIGAMSAMLAHEIKNPLVGIRGAAQLLEPGLSREDQQLTRLIRDECDRVCNLVDRMDAIASPTLSRGALNIHAVLDHVLQLAKAGFAGGIAFTTDYDPSLPPAFGDRDQLVQVFLNLIKNAVSAISSEGGRVTIKTEYRHDIRLGGRDRVHLPLQVKVCDNGSGIPKEISPYVFDPFVTTRAGGTGLGLALVAKVVTEHGGTVDFDSGEAGTEFCVRLPIVEQRRGIQMGKPNG